MAIIAAEDLVYDYPGARALDGVSFEVAPGTITALVGPNGAGKTTLLRCLAVLDRPAEGRIWLDGMDVANHPRESHRKLGYLSDFYGLYDELTVRQCLSYHAAIHDLAPAAQAEAAERAAARMGLAALMNRRAQQLSRGQRQRLAIAQAIIHDPALLLLDEPAAGLDPEARWSLSSLIADLAKGGMTLIVSSHILSELEDYSTHVMIIRGGRLVLHKPLSEAAAAIGADSAVRQTCMRVEIAAPDSGFERALKGFAAATRIAVHGTSASVFIPADADARAALLRHCVGAGLPVVAYVEDRARVEEIYFALSADAAAAAGAPAPGGKAP
ncbi:MAG TPA: heme ABC exporter ATP-binding protein CcmA [Alphaproteobacteria bacterium]|jgi:ABC-2 type transport system ATP-binding protein